MGEVGLESDEGAEIIEGMRKIYEYILYCYVA